MTETGTRGPVRKVITRALAASALLALYTFNTVAMSGVVLTTAGMSQANAQWRGRGRGRGWGRGRGRGWGPAIGLGIGAAIVGGAIAADQARRGSAVEYCLSRFRSYKPSTGTYTGYDGYEHPCP